MFVYAYYNFFKGGLSDKDKVTGYAKEHNHNILSSFSDDEYIPVMVYVSNTITQGITTRKNNTFSRAALQSILRNDFYIGISTYQGIKTEGKHTPLIDKDLFDKVGQILSSNAKCTKK